RDLARACFINRTEVALAQNLRVSQVGLGDIQQPAVEHQGSVLHGCVADGEVIGLNRWRSPVAKPESSRRCTGARWLAEIFGPLRYLKRVHALGDHFKQARILQIAE